MAYQLSEENQKRLQELKERYPSPMSAILPGLHLVYEERGWVDREACDHVAELLGVPAIHVYEAMTFYTYFPQKPVGKYRIMVCHNIACNLRGAESIIDYMKDKHGVKENEVSEDGLFSLERAECLGACGGAPMMQVNDTYHEDLSFEVIDELFDRWRKEKGEGAKRA